MRIAVVSDEISEDFAEAVELGTLLEIDTYELRWVRPPGGLRHRRIGEISDDAAATLAATARRHGVTISALSPGLFHGRWDDLTLGYEFARLDRSLHLAQILGAKAIVVHGFRPPDDRRNGVCPPTVIEVLSEAASRAREAGCVLLLRNAPDSYADSGEHTASIVHAVHSPALAVSWDPCHAVRAGETAIRDGYEWVAPFVRDVRVKDQRCDEHGYEYTVLAEGMMDWIGQLAALRRDGYQGTATLGAQIEPRLLSTMQSLDALRKLMRAVRAA